MFRLYCFLLFLCGTFCTGLALPHTWPEAGAKEYFVSTDGSDADDVPGTKTSPWRTPAHAIKQLSGNHPNHAVILTMRGGVYYQSELIKLGIDDKYLTIQNYEDEEVTISGGFPLDINWQKKGNILTGKFSGSCSEAFYGNYRLLPARSPNTEWGINFNIAKEPYHHVTDLLAETETCKKNSTSFSQSCPEEDRNGFIFKDEFSEDWEFLNQTKVLIYHSWIAEYAQVANISQENGKKKVMFQDPLEHAAVGDYIKSGDLRFLIFNNLALLDMPGEYVCIENGDEAQFSYIPPTDSEVEIPIMSKLEVIVLVQGTNHITLRGIKFQHSSYYGRDFWNFGSAAPVRVKDSHHVTIDNCEFSHTAMLGLAILDSTNITAQQNVFYDIGYHGVMVRDVVKTEDVLIANNYFDGIGISRFWQPCGIWITGKKNMYAINNEITNTANGGFHAGGGPNGANFWNESGVINPTREDYLVHIEFNYVHDFGQGILNDYGGIKTGVSAQCDGATVEELNERCHAYVHVFNNLVLNGKAYLNGANLLYSDAASSRMTFENNILLGSGEIALYHHCGVDNVSKNNIIHRTTNSNTGYMNIESSWGGCERHSASHQAYSNYQNIYLLENADDFMFYRIYDRFDWESPVFYENLYWSKNPTDKDNDLFPVRHNWDEWIQTGNDANSVWADPKLADPSSGLYELADDSPAWDLGIKQIQLDNFGIQENVKLFYKKDFMK